MAAKTPVYFIPWKEKGRLTDLIEKSGAMDVALKNHYIAIKMHFGERGNDGYIKPEFVRPFIKAIKQKKAKPFLTDTNTIYHGPRNNAVGHLEVAAEHGFSLAKLQTPIIISDGLRGNEYKEVQIDCKHFPSVKIGRAIYEADAMIALSHFKGHLLAGFGGAIKNLGMGCGSRIGKFAMHSSVAPTVAADNCTACGKCILQCAHGALTFKDKMISLDKKKCVGCGECAVVCKFGALSIEWDDNAANVQERTVEYAFGAVKDKPFFCVNFLNHITPNCDCISKKETPLLDDIGILASSCPVAIDQASIDIVIKNGGDVFKKTYPNIDWNVQLEYSEKIGLGKREYELITI